MPCFAHRYQLGLADGTRMPFAEPGVEPHYAPDRVVRIHHAHIELSVEPAERTFSGTATLRLEALPTFDGSFSLDLDEVEVLAVTDPSGEPLSYRHGDGKLTVTCAQVPHEVVVRWQGSDPRRGLYFTGPAEHAPDRQHMAWTQCQDEDGHFVFPCHDHPGIKHTWTLELDAPAGYTLLSNGTCVESGDRDGRARARYEQREPMPAYLVTLVAARLTVIEAAWRDKPVRYLVPEGEEAHVQRAFGKTPQMIAHFSERFGVDYPWPRYDQVVVHEFIFGGMENTACTTMTDLLLVDEKGALEWDPDGLVAHELAHQWFGDLVTCQDWSQGWLNESWATYSEALWWEHDRDAAEATWYRRTAAAGYLAEHSGRYRRPIVSYRFREPIDVFDRHLYNKGSCVLWTLRHELGDEAFFAGVRHYLQGHRHGTVHTRHFQRALEEATGRNLDGFFHQWVHSAGHPQVDVKLSKGDDQVVVKVEQTQSGDDVPDAFTFVLRLQVVYDDGDTRTIDLKVEDRERAYVIPAERTVRTVRVDPGYRVLAEISLSGPEAWLTQLLHDDCPVLAVRAGEALLKEGRVSARDAVLAAMRSHEFHGVRSSLARALGKLGTDTARDHLVVALAAESDPRVRRAIAEALGGFRDEAAADALVALLDEDLPTWQLEGSALLALGKTRDPRAAEVLSARLDVECWADWVPQRALMGLAQTRDVAVLDAVIERSRTGSDRLRGAAASALGTLGDRVESTRTRVVERLVEMLTEDGFRAQLSAIAALGRVRDPEALPALSRVHRSAPDGRTRRMAYEATVRVRQGRTTEAGLAALRSKLEALSEDNAKLRERIDRLER